MTALPNIVDIPVRDSAYWRDSLKSHEVKLAAAKRQRDVIQIDMRKAAAGVDTGDQKARHEQVRLNKDDAAASRLIQSIQHECSEAAKRVAMAEGQEAAAALKRAQLDDAGVPHDKLFEVATPDGRIVRHRHASAGALQKMLQPGYRVVAEVLGADNDDKGGLVEPIGQSTMKTLLAVHGDELISFLAERGIKSITA